MPHVSRAALAGWFQQRGQGAEGVAAGVACAVLDAADAVQVPSAVMRPDSPRGPGRDRRTDVLRLCPRIPSGRPHSTGRQREVEYQQRLG